MEVFDEEEFKEQAYKAWKEGFKMFGPFEAYYSKVRAQTIFYYKLNDNQKKVFMDYKKKLLTMTANEIDRFNNREL